MHRIDHQYATPGGWAGDGNLTTGSAVITNIEDTSGIKVGDYVYVDLGYAADGPCEYKVLAKTANTITIPRTSNRTAAGINITSIANLFTDGDAFTGVPRTIVTPEWANGIQEEITRIIEAAGITLNKYNNQQLHAALLAIISQHTHAGVDALGNAAKVNLELHVTGVLPAANIGTHEHSGVAIAKVDPVNHILGAAEGSFVLVFNNDEFTEHQSITVSWKSEAGTSANPQIVRLTFPNFSAESAGLTMGTTLVVPALPAELRPKDDIYVPVMVKNNGFFAAGVLHISPTGHMEWYLGNDVFGFTNSGNKGFGAFTIQYPVYPEE